MVALSFKDAAAALGFRSRSTLYRLREDGRLADYLRPGGRGGALLLETDPPGLPSLKAQVACCLQIRMNNIERITESITPRTAPPKSLRKNRLNSRISPSYELIALCSG